MVCQNRSNRYSFISMRPRQHVVDKHKQNRILPKFPDQQKGFKGPNHPIEADVYQRHSYGQIHPKEYKKEEESDEKFNLEDLKKQFMDLKDDWETYRDKLDRAFEKFEIILEDF